MDGVGNLKLIEVGVIVIALGLFAWWQLRDIKRAKEKTAAERAASQSADRTAKPSSSPTNEPPKT
jgi:hypothetical protein